MPLRARPAPLETRVVSGVEPDPETPRRIAAQFRRMLTEGTHLRPVGEARHDPELVLERGDVPRHAVDLFGVRFFLTDFRHDHWLNFMIAFVGVPHPRTGRTTSLFPRIFYKDPSLMWRVASHYISTEDEHWIGKGDVRWEQRSDGEYLSSAEETTDLPYEIQGALDEISRRRKSKRDDDAVHLYLRRGGSHRTEPFADFTKPRREAHARYRVNGGRPVARFRKKNDPTSLVFARGYQPDLRRGLVEVTHSGSKLYGGEIEKYRILSVNREIQYQFVASPTHAFVNHPQALTTGLSSYGTRCVDVIADEDAFLPGFEYHFYDDVEDPPVLYSQIPEGWAGDKAHPDCERADASRWIEELPVIRDFRRIVLGG